MLQSQQQEEQKENIPTLIYLKEFGTMVDAKKKIRTQLSNENKNVPWRQKSPIKKYYALVFLNQNLTVKIKSCYR